MPDVRVVSVALSAAVSVLRKRGGRLNNIVVGETSSVGNFSCGPVLVNSRFLLGSNVLRGFACLRLG